MTDCCLCVCLRPRTYQRLIKDVFASNYEHRNDLSAENYSKGKFDRLVQYIIHYPNKLELIMFKLESKFVKFYVRNEIGQQLLLLEILKAVVKDYSEISLQSLLEQHYLFFITEALRFSQQRHSSGPQQQEDLLILKSITLLLKECIKYQIFYSYDTFLHQTHSSQLSLPKSPQSKKNSSSLSKNDPEEDHYDFIFLILKLANNVIIEERKKKLREILATEEEKSNKLSESHEEEEQEEEKSDELERILFNPPSEKSDKKSRTSSRSSRNSKIPTISTGLPLHYDETDSFSCLGLTMIITVFGLFRINATTFLSKNDTSSSGKGQNVVNQDYNNHIHNLNNKYFHIIFQSMIRLLIFVSPNYEKKCSVTEIYPNYEVSDVVSSIFQQTKAIIQQQHLNIQSSGGSGKITSSATTVSFLLWKILKLFFSYQTILNNSILLEEMIIETLDIFQQFEIPMNSILFMKLFYFMEKTYSQTYQQFHSSSSASTSSSAPSSPTPMNATSNEGVGMIMSLTTNFFVEPILLKFIINRIFSGKWNNSSHYQKQFFSSMGKDEHELKKLQKKDSKERKDYYEALLEEFYYENNEERKLNHSSLLLDKEKKEFFTVNLSKKNCSLLEYYAKFNLKKTIPPLQRELISFNEFLLDGSELFQRNVLKNFHFLQNSLGFLSFYMKFYPFSSKSSENSLLQSNLKAILGHSNLSSSTEQSKQLNLDDLMSLTFHLQLIVSFLLKTNHNYLFSKDLFTKNNEIFTTTEEEADSSMKKHIIALVNNEKNEETRGGNTNDNKFISLLRKSYRRVVKPSALLCDSPNRSAKGPPASYDKLLSLSKESNDDDEGDDEENQRIIRLKSKGSERSGEGTKDGADDELFYQNTSAKKNKNQKKVEYDLLAQNEDKSTTRRKSNSTVEAKDSSQLMIDNILSLSFAVLAAFLSPPEHNNNPTTYEWSGNVGKTLEVILQKAYVIEKNLFHHHHTASMTDPNHSSSIQQNANHKYYQLQYFYYYNFLFLEKIFIKMIPFNYSSMILFNSLQDSEINPQDKSMTTSNSSMILTTRVITIIDYLLKSTQEMECFQQILLFLMKLISKLSYYLNISNRLTPEQLLKSVFGADHEQKTDLPLLKGNNSSSLPQNKDYSQMKRYYKHQTYQILSYLIPNQQSKQLLSQLNMNKGAEDEKEGENDFSLAKYSLDELENVFSSIPQASRNNRDLMISFDANYQKMFLFYPYTIYEFHSFLSMIFNHLMNLSSEYYIPKLVFYWNFHVSSLFDSFSSDSFNFLFIPSGLFNTVNWRKLSFGHNSNVSQDSFVHSDHGKQFNAKELSLLLYSPIFPFHCEFIAIEWFEEFFASRVFESFELYEHYPGEHRNIVFTRRK
jgi:hypothetical protein